MGRLGIDSKSVPIDKKEKTLRGVLDFSNIDFSKKDLTIDENIKAKPPINNVDPSSRFAGVGSSAVIPFKDSERLWALRRDLAQKKLFLTKYFLNLEKNSFLIHLKFLLINIFIFSNIAIH
ncbi:hypothetical protein [Polaribacter ponticola]|uniref:Uncharacterized protein n=1 Tax=Polaribacter ponticola TaxID=2978475 RepID=A0ABT5SCR8_9FLAO|nr:hypothetical protein [Polaribacter sp. MSW5]MDD7915928.1 hypothetical protein [Polaribacter sp. MSW5]